MYQVIWAHGALQNFNANNPSRNVPTLPGASLRINNLSNRGVSVFDGSGNQIEYIGVYQYAILSNTRDFRLVLDSATTVDWLHPLAAVSVRDIADSLPYEVGELIQTSIQAPLAEYNVTGNVNATIQNDTMNVTGSVNATIQNATLPISGSVEISGTPNVQITGTPQMEISGTPTFQLASGAAVNATIQNAQLNSQITNALIGIGPMPTTIAQTFTVNLTPGQASSYNVGVPLGMYDSFFIRINSSQGNVNNYSLTDQYTVLLSFGLQTEVVNLTVNWAAQNTQIGFSSPVNLPTPSVFDTVQVQIKNVGSTTITGDSVTLQIYPKYSSQSLNYALKSFSQTGLSIASETVPAGSKGVINYSNVITANNLKRAQLYVVSNGQGYTSGQAGLAVALQGSFDNSTWFDIVGSSSVPSFYSCTLSGANYGAVDTSILPQIEQGYPYLRFKYYQYNNAASGSYVMGNTLINLYFYYNI